MTDLLFLSLGILWAFTAVLLMVGLIVEPPRAIHRCRAWWKKRRKPMAVSAAWLREHQVLEAEQKFRTIR